MNTVKQIILKKGLFQYVTLTNKWNKTGTKGNWDFAVVDENGKIKSLSDSEEQANHSKQWYTNCEVVKITK